MRKRKLTKMGGKALFVMVLSSALLAAGCMEEGGAFGGTGVTERTLGLRMEATTKVSVDDASGACAWTSGDAIAVRIYGTAPAENKYDIPVVDAAGRTVNVNLEGDQDIRWYSVYPASARVDEKYGNPELQVKYASSYALPSGLSNEQLKLWSPLPMVAQNTAGSTSLAFFHVGGVLRLKLENVPASATSCTVTLQGMEHVTGTYKVSDPGTSTAATSLVSGAGEGNAVAFTNLPASQTTLWLSVPLPTGDYASLTSVKVEAGGKAVTKAVKWNGGMGHAQGRRLSFNFDAQAGELDNVSLSPAGDATLWKGQPYQCVAMACDVNGLFVSGATISWSSSDASVAEVDNAGNVTAKAAGSAVLTATATVGTSTATADYTVYVNEITGLTLSCGSTLTLRTGTASPVTATATYTANGTPEVPEVNWVVAPTTLAALATDVTVSGAANSITGGSAVGSGTLTVSIPANRYGSNDPQSATCSFKILSSNYLPGAFSISPTEQVYFSKGNLQVNYTNSGGTVTREWLFSENQWDVFFPTADELDSLPTPADGTTVKISHFGWATAGHKNPSSPDGDNAYAYNTEQQRFEPHEWRGMSTGKYYAVTSPVWSSLGLSTQAWNADNDWKRKDDLRLYCDWGIHFDDAGVGYDDKYDGTSWFTLSQAQWKYLLVDRPGADHKVAAARIIFDPQNVSQYSGCVNGIVILPDDDWQLPAGCTFIPANAAHYDSDNARWTVRTDNGVAANSYDITTAWPLMEAAGAVFLPSINSRKVPGGGTFNSTYPYDFNSLGSPYHGGVSGNYWSSSIGGGSAYGAGFFISIYTGSISLTTGVAGGANGYGVRLVHYAN